MTADPEPPPAAEEETVDNVTDVDPAQEIVDVGYDITSYGADFLVDGLMTRMAGNDIVVPTFDPAFSADSDAEGFQRHYVWTKPQADRFLESLLLGMPVPGIFLVREPNGIFLVLDGHQRLRSLASFYEGIFREKEYKLEYVQEPWRGLRYRDLEDEDRRRLDNSIIHATILRQDNPQRDYQAIYSIFERINTGGTALQPQEIRVALFVGPFIQLIRELNRDASWRSLYGPVSTRLKDQELILRFFALYEDSSAYRRPVKGFLNDYLAKNVARTADDASALIAAFRQTADTISGSVGSRAFRPVRAINAAVLDAVMVGVARRLAAGPVTDSTALTSAYDGLLAVKEFQEATGSSTAAEESVSSRLSLATAAFSQVA
jgi:hypothetical protein